MKKNRQQPDLIVTARRCYSLEPRERPAEALVIRDGRIIARGRYRVLRELKKRGTRVIDLGEGVVTPGLVDCHTHFFYWALHRARGIDVSEQRSLAGALGRIAKESRSKTFGDWVVARGFDYNTWSEGIPNARDLDRAVPDGPAMVHSRDGHSVWLNTAALRQLGITARTRDPKGGRYLRDERGRPTGIVQELAIDLLPDPVREFAERSDPAAVRAVDRALDQAEDAARSLGLIGVHCVDDAASLSHLQRRHRARRLGMRFVHGVPVTSRQHAFALGLRTGLGDDWLRIGAIKVFADGALGSQTAHMFRPYPGREDFCGVATLDAEELREIAIEAARAGWALWIHAIGDRAVHDVISAIAAARRVEQSPLRHRIEHVQCIRPADIRRMARLGIVASVQPCHVMGDIRTAERHWPRASRNAYPFRAMLDAGVTLALGSDVPIESLDPRRGLFGAVSRTEEGGYPAGGWYAQQRMSVIETLHGYTRGARDSIGGPELSGTLNVGAPADLTLWHDDPFKAAPADLLDLRIAGCVVGGCPHLNADV